MPKLHEQEMEEMKLTEQMKLHKELITWLEDTQLCPIEQKNLLHEAIDFINHKGTLKILKEENDR